MGKRYLANGGIMVAHDQRGLPSRSPSCGGLSPGLPVSSRHVKRSKVQDMGNSIGESGADFRAATYTFVQ
jgi:hypothetical protein